MKKLQPSTQRGSTIILKLAIVAVALAALLVYGLALPAAIRVELAGDFDYLPVLAGLYLPAVPLFIALHQAHKLLGYIDRQQAFSQASVNALRRVKYCGLAISGLFAAGMPYVFHLADQEDAPGLAVIGFVLVGASFVVGMAAALFERLFQQAVELKAENDLTV